MARGAKNIVYGEYEDELVFIPAARARHLALTWKAMLRARTWGELRKFAPPRAYDEILKFNEPRSIRAWHSFDYVEMTPAPDGDYPGFPRQEVMQWMPARVWQTLARMVDTAVNGEYPSFDPLDELEIVAALEECGYHCRRNQRLVDAAHGD
jgi:hypothetical protein